MKTKWSQEAWQAALPYYKAIVELPFIKELAAGTLDRERFIFYLRQDALYIYNYCRVLSHIASRLTRQDELASFLGFAGDGVAVEQAMHTIYLSNVGPAEAMTPSCMLYCSLQSAQATAPVEVEAASILPCFWVYLEVGRHIASIAAPGNPYQAWIDTYSDPAFDISNNRAIEICDRLADDASPAVRQAMTDMFVLCTRMEWLFWHSAYQLEKWEI